LDRDLDAVAKGNICRESDYAECREEMDGPGLEWACSQCPKLPVETIHPYTQKLLSIRQLQQAGFPLDAEILNYNEWLDLGRVNECLTQPPLKLL